LRLSFDAPEVFGTTLLQSSINYCRSRIVGCGGEIPSAIIIMQIFKIARRRPGGFHRIAPFIDPFVDPQTILTRCARDKLPESDGARARDVGGDEFALEQSEITELFR